MGKKREVLNVEMPPELAEWFHHNGNLEAMRIAKKMTQLARAIRSARWAKGEAATGRVDGVSWEPSNPRTVGEGVGSDKGYGIKFTVPGEECPYYSYFPSAAVRDMCLAGLDDAS